MSEPRHIGPIVREEADRLRGGISGIGKRKPHIRRSWDRANEKREAEQFCRNCGAYPVEMAHIIGREHDAVPPIRSEHWSPYDVHPDRVIPLCHECHQGPQGQHAKRLDTLPLLDLNEQLQAVADAGGIARAYTLLMPSESPKRVAA